VKLNKEISKKQNSILSTEDLEKKLNHCKGKIKMLKEKIKRLEDEEDKMYEE
jgi:hypothetical protein